MPACFGDGELDMSKTDEIDHLVGVLKDVAPKAEKQGVVIGLENYLSAEDNCESSNALALRPSRCITTWAIRPTRAATSSKRSAVGQADLRVSRQGRQLHAR